MLNVGPHRVAGAGVTFVIGPTQVDALGSGRRDATDEFGRDAAAATLSPMIDDVLHLGGVPSHDDIGKQTQGIGNRPHLLGLFELMTGDAAGVDRPLGRPLSPNPAIAALRL
jgi:hypothetical protein